MRNRFLTRLLVTSTVLGVFACPADGALITFNTRTAFNAAAPGLPVETFESRDAQGVLICPGPLMRGQECPMTPDTVLPEPPFDGLLPGITYSSTSGILVLLGPDFLSYGNTSNVLGPYAAGDTMDLTLESASAIGFDVFPGIAPADILISVFDSLNAPIGTFTILASPGGTFFGVLSDSGLIGRINVDTLAEFQGGLVDDVAFGDDGPGAGNDPSHRHRPRWLVSGNRAQKTPPVSLNQRIATTPRIAFHELFRIDRLDDVCRSCCQRPFAIGRTSVGGESDRPALLCAQTHSSHRCDKMSGLRLLPIVSRCSSSATAKPRSCSRASARSSRH